MPTLFPRMDPYLERPGLWQQVHTSLIVDIQRFLNPSLRPNYYVAIEQTTYLTLLPSPPDRVGRPDALVVSSTKALEGAQTATTESAASAVTAVEPIVAELPQPEEIKHRYLEIRKAETHDVVTTLEILSPSNKLSREGREQYERKRIKILGSLTNLVEIDLLRAGEPMPMKIPRQDDYRIVVSRSHQRPQADVYLFNVRQAVPDIPIPLQPDEPEPILPLNRLLHDLYDAGSYDLMIDYSNPPVPPLSQQDVKWAADILAKSH